MESIVHEFLEDLANLNLYAGLSTFLTEGYDCFCNFFLAFTEKKIEELDDMFFEHKNTRSGYKVVRKDDVRTLETKLGTLSYKRRYYHSAKEGYHYLVDDTLSVNPRSRVEKGFPIIAYNPRGSYAPPEGLDEDFNPICSGGYKLVYWGKDCNYLKFRCPHAVGKCNCPHGMSWCSNSNYGYTFKVNYKDNPRYYGYPLRYTNSWQIQYDKRTSVERCNSRLKCYLNLSNVRSKGIKKVKVHALLNCIALISSTIAVNTAKSLNKAA